MINTFAFTQCLIQMKPSLNIPMSECLCMERKLFNKIKFQKINHPHITNLFGILMLYIFLRVCETNIPDMIGAYVTNGKCIRGYGTKFV